MDPISILTACEYLFFGLTLLINPDYFWNPADGLFKAVSGGRETELDSNHFDPIFQITSMMKGAGLLSIGVMFLMAREDTMAKKDCYRTALFANFFLFLVYFQTVRAADNKYLNLPMIGFYAGFFFTNTLWFVAELFRKSPDTLKRHRAPTWPHTLFLVAHTLNLGGFGLLDMFYPHGHDPDSAMPFWNKTTLPDNTKDDLAVFQCRAHSALLLAFACSAFEILLFDRSVERIRWWSQCSVPAYAFYLIVFVRAALDDTGYAYKEAWASLALFEFLFLLGCLALTSGKVTWTPSKSIDGTKKNTREKTEARDMAPELTTEQGKKKLK